MRPLRAVTLPQCRAALVQQLRRDAAGLNEESRYPWMDAENAATIQHLWQTEAKAMATASLWWITPDMVTLAADTGLSDDELPEWTRTAETRSGLMIWDGGLPVRVINRDSVPLAPIDAVSWLPMPSASQHPSMGGMRVRIWSRAEATAKSPLRPILTSVGAPDDPLVAVGGTMMRPELAVWRVLCATMLLSQEPRAAVTRPANFAKDSSARDPRTREVPEVTVIDLRTARDWTHGPFGEPAAERREYTHRWIVRGHMRTYHVGPRDAQKTERRWIAPYVAGPPGAPLVPKEHVWVWRR